jgi:heptosyltransferase II
VQITRYLNKNKRLHKIAAVSIGGLISFIRMFNPKNKNQDKNIGVVSFHMIGDTVFTIPAIREIYKYYQDYHIKIFTNTNGKMIYSHIFPDAEITEIEKTNFLFNGRVAVSRARKIIKEKNLQIIFDITGNLTSASLVINSPARIIGMNIDLYKKVYDTYIPIRKDPHLIDRYLDVAASEISISDRSGIMEHPINLNLSGKILIHPFAGWAAKEWGEEKFFRLANDLAADYSVGFIGNKNFDSAKLNSDQKNNNIEFIITENLELLITEIKKCSLFISNDSGPLYLANLFGKPTFTIYGPTNPNHSMPVGSYHRFIRKLISCSPLKDQYCHTHAGHFCPYYECMDTLSVQEVLQSVKNFVNELNIINKRKVSIN